MRVDEAEKLKPESLRRCLAGALHMRMQNQQLVNQLASKEMAGQGVTVIEPLLRLLFVNDGIWRHIAQLTLSKDDEVKWVSDIALLEALNRWTVVRWKMCNWCASYISHLEVFDGQHTVPDYVGRDDSRCHGGQCQRSDMALVQTINCDAAQLCSS